jgi:hypothetical protein
VPTLVPPLVQLEGGKACGPNTLNEIVPPAPAVAPLTVEPTALAATALPATVLPGAAKDAEVAFVTAVEAMPLPHVLADGLLLVSPP